VGYSTQPYPGQEPFPGEGHNPFPGEASQPGSKSLADMDPSFGSSSNTGYGGDFGAGGYAAPEAKDGGETISIAHA